MKLLGLAETTRYSGAEMVSDSVEQLDQEAFFVSASPVMRQLRAQAELLAQADVPVFILGESGSGKDAVARLIHKLSVRSSFRFVKFHCGAMPAEVLENELFDSAHYFGTSQSGKAAELRGCEYGTVLLDEVTEMPGSLQSRLVDALRSSDLRQGNEADGSRSGLRILASSSCSIEQALAANKLREDLYYRLSAFMLRVPPLRQRREEIPLLLRYSMHQMAKHYGLPGREFSPAMLDACKRYSWPGNLRELEAFVKRYLVSGDQALAPGEMDTVLARNVDSSAPTPEPKATAWKPAVAESADVAPKSLKSFIQTLKCEAEKNAISAALERTGWNRKAAARLLKVSYRTLLYKIEQYKMTAALGAISNSAAEDAKRTGKLG